MVTFCAHCGAPTEIVEHQFYVGTRETEDGRPRIADYWTVYAPLYFKSTEDRRGVLEVYCGPVCSNLGHHEYNNKEAREKAGRVRAAGH